MAPSLRGLVREARLGELVTVPINVPRHYVPPPSRREALNDAGSVVKDSEGRRPRRSSSAQAERSLIHA